MYFHQVLFVFGSIHHARDPPTKIHPKIKRIHRYFLRLRGYIHRHTSHKSLNNPKMVLLSGLFGIWQYNHIRGPSTEIHPKIERIMWFGRNSSNFFISINHVTVIMHVSLSTKNQPIMSLSYRTALVPQMEHIFKLVFTKIKRSYSQVTMGTQHRTCWQRSILTPDSHLFTMVGRVFS